MGHKWKVEAVLCGPDGEEKDWLEIQPGPAMRGWLQGHRGVIGGGWSAFLRVIHLASMKGVCADVIPSGKIAFSAKINGDLVTLERAARIMKDELEALHEEVQRINERG